VAARLGDRIEAVVSRGGRPDLALDYLPRVVAPTLLIVGGEDHRVIELNEAAQTELRCTRRLVVVPGATHLFEEPGALETVADLAAGWFARHIRPLAGA
jgi:pimeloyl-ACP methyl ester carboxylesterase